jgi:hypothetical protein
LNSGDINASILSGSVDGDAHIKAKGYHELKADNQHLKHNLFALEKKITEQQTDFANVIFSHAIIIIIINLENKRTYEFI